MEDGEYNKTIKNARKTLEVPMEAALPCKMETRNCGKRVESILPSNHEDHIAVKGLNSMAHHKLVHKFVPMHQAMKISGAKKAAKDKEWTKHEKVAAWQLDKVIEQEMCYSGSTKKKWEVHFATLMDICHLKNAELIQRTSRAPV